MSICRIALRVRERSEDRTKGHSEYPCVKTDVIVIVAFDIPEREKYKRN